MRTLFLALSFVVIAPVSAQDSLHDWPHFLGPEASGKTTLTDADFNWGDAGPEPVWKLDIGTGYGGVSVRDGKVFMLDREAGEADILRVMDLYTGEELWDFAYLAEGRLNFPGSRTVPTVTETHIYTVSGLGMVTCFSRAERNIVWSVHMEEVYGGVIPGFGWSNSPLLVGDNVIVTPLGEEVGMVALNKETGEEAWITDGLGISHSSPVLLNLVGKDQVVFISKKGNRGDTDSGMATVSGFDPSSGDLLWQIDTPGTNYPIPAAVRVDDGRFFITGGYRGGSSMMSIAKGDGGYELEALFHIDRGSQVHTPILHDDHLYLIVNENWNYPRPKRKEGGLLCLDLEGKECWRTEDDPFFGRGNAVFAGGYLMVQDGFDGVLRVSRVNSESYEQVAEADMFKIEDRKDHEMWAPMALADGLLLMRSKEELICVRLSAGA